MEFSNQSVHQFGLLGQTLRSMTIPKDQFAEMAKSIRAANQSFCQLGSLGQTLRSMTIPTNQLAEMAKSISAISAYTSDIPKDDIIINDDNTLSCANKTFNLNNVESDLRNIVEEIIDPQNINRRFDNLDKKLDSLKKDPLYKQILIAILVWIIITFCLEPLIKNQLAQYPAQNKNSVVKRIQKKISSSNIEKDLLKDYRIVKANVLDVRAKNTRKSKIRGKLYLGQLVYVVKKNKNWTLIESKDSEDSVVLKGWVFNRYLKKITQ